MKKIFRYFGYLIFRPIWMLERLIPRNEKLWIFGAWYGKKYSDNSKYLFEYVLNNNPEINAIWITKSNDIYEYLKHNNKPVYKANSIKGIYYCLKSKYAFLTSGVVDVNKFCLNGCRQIWLWHGMPLKKIGYCIDENISKIKLKRSKFFNPYNYLAPYATISSSEFFNEYLEKAFKLSKDMVWNTGLPRCDIFFSDKHENFIDKIKSKFVGSKILVYMPTFRMSFNMEGNPFSPFIEEYEFNETNFIDFLERNNVVLLYKPHFVDSNIDISINSNRFILINDSMFEDLYCLLNSVDGLLTDYSSVYFDFLPTMKPVFLLPFDLEEYVKYSRGHFFDMYKEMSCPFISRNWDEFYRSFYRFEENGYKSNDKDKFASFLDGKSCKNLVEKVTSEIARK